MSVTTPIDIITATIEELATALDPMAGQSLQGWPNLDPLLVETAEQILSAGVSHMKALMDLKACHEEISGAARVNPPGAVVPQTQLQRWAILMRRADEAIQLSLQTMTTAQDRHDALKQALSTKAPTLPN